MDNFNKTGRIPTMNKGGKVKKYKKGKKVPKTKEVFADLDPIRRRVGKEKVYKSIKPGSEEYVRYEGDLKGKYTEKHRVNILRRAMGLEPTEENYIKALRLINKSKPSHTKEKNIERKYKLKKKAEKKQMGGQVAGGYKPTADIPNMPNFPKDVIQRGYGGETAVHSSKKMGAGGPVTTYSHSGYKAGE